ncbi:glycoside hydrolase family 88/105 protein [Galbibacter pacificus]|uniref:Glycoside hydrolase family 88 protein n=1 Tax=Galbibacter pacificus TaxID=2996052 RepID=A0ABT6FP72_9FLAO|nr:glycoside hydrolase family 88 protein [Galbibacter pacificus]MDG3581585.1 glycoside hydrolase family 88 protein [Galbibacter pacificus]MDG3585063.1 glycoside hydrolase family 88 protein [Galbibacter pacificus]
MKFTYCISFMAILAISASFFSCKKTEKKAETTTSRIKMVVDSTEKWSEKMAKSIMYRNPEAWQIDDAKRPKWDYVHGLVSLAFEKLYAETQNKAYYDYAKGYADALIDSSGNIVNYEIEKYNIDMINAGKILFDLYAKTNDKRYKIAMDTLRLQLKDQPRTKSGGFWHKKRYPNQMWLDGLYMGAPFYTQYTTTFEEGKALNDIAKQFQLIETNAKDPNTGLLYHGWDESRQMEWADKKTGTSPNFWSRSLGWYAMALVDVLDYFPENHPKKQELITSLNQLATAVVAFQDESGLWYQVPNMGDRDGNYLEASGSAMLTYALAKGVNKGYLPDYFMENATKGFNGLTTKLIKVQDNGTITLTQVCAVAGLGGNPYRDGTYKYYINERKKDNDPKGTGPFILAALQLDK